MAEPGEKSLKRADGDIAPQGYDEAKEEFDFIQLRDGRQLTRDDKVEKKLDELIDATGEAEVKFPDDFPDKDVKSELESMKETQKDMMDAIKNTNETLENVIKDGSVNTQLTGSIVEDDRLKVENKRIIDFTEKGINIDPGMNYIKQMDVENVNLICSFVTYTDGVLKNPGEDFEVKIKISNKSSGSMTSADSPTVSQTIEMESTGKYDRGFTSKDKTRIYGKRVRLTLVNKTDEDLKDIYLWIGQVD